MPKILNADPGNFGAIHPVEICVTT